MHFSPMCNIEPTEHTDDTEWPVERKYDEWELENSASEIKAYATVKGICIGLAK